MGQRDLLLGIDVGTSTAKVILADVHGAVLWQSCSSYGYQSPQPEYAEQDPSDWWKAICDSTQSLFREHPGTQQRVAAVGVSGQGVAAVLLDSNGAVLRPAILWLDRRCAADAEQLKLSHGDTIAKISGKQPASYNFEPKLRWIQRNEPEIWSHTWKALTTTSFITYRLTGDPIVNHSDGGIFLGYDLAARQWSIELLELMGLRPSVYGDLAESDAVVGRITVIAAAQTGIPYGVPVVAGGEDTSSAGLAMGVFKSDTAQLSLGTASTVNVPVDHAVIHPQLLSFPHVLRNVTLIGGSMSSGGLAIEWITKVVSGGSCSNEHMSDLTKEAASLEPGAGGLIFLPYLAGELQPIHDGFARGVFFGLSAEMGRAHLMRAVLEGTVMAIEHNLSLAREVGVAPRRLVAVGGPTRSRLLCQIISDVTGQPLVVMPESSGAALGSAILAAKGVQLSSHEAMQAGHARPQATFRPNAARHEMYRAVLRTYVELYPRIKDLYPRCSRWGRSETAETNEHVHL